MFYSVFTSHETFQQQKKVITPSMPKSISLTSREDIRKKLASFGEDEAIPEEEEEGGTNSNLEICFINETASDDEEDIMVNPLEALSDDEDTTANSISNHNFIPRSKSNWEAFRPDDNVQDEVNQQLEEEKQKIQASAKVALSQCKQIARRQLVMEKQKRLGDDPLKRLLGITYADVSEDVLSNYNINTLQVITLISFVVSLLNLGRWF